MPGKEVTTVFLTYTTLGGYLKNPANIEADFPKNAADVGNAIDGLLSNLVVEANSIDSIKNFDLAIAKRRIMDSHDECVTERMNIEAAQAAEDILEAAAIAADVALVAASWTIFGAIGLGIAAIAAEAAASGAELGVEKLEHTITQMIADMGLKAFNDPALASIKMYHDSSGQVSINIAKIELGGNKAIVRQSLLGLAKTSETVDEMKKNLIHFYDVVKKPGDIIGMYMMLAELMIQGDGGPSAQKIILDLKKAGEAPLYIKFAIHTIGALGLTSSIAVARFTKQIEKMFVDESIMSIEDIGSVVQLSTKAEAMGKCVKGLAAVGAALETVMLGLTIADQRGTINEINKQIENRKNDLITYYTTFHEAVTAPESASRLAAAVLGSYECHKYDNTATKNDWHYVTITKVNDMTFKWTNRAGVSWTLKTTSENTMLDVGQECPYYDFDDGTSKTRYTQATLVWNGDEVSGILGPWDELYERSTT